MAEQELDYFPIDSLSVKVRLLDQKCQELSHIMQEQLKAVVASDAERVMELTEKNASVQQQFHHAEQSFMEEMQSLELPKSADGRHVTLEKLKNSYPGYAGFISDWQDLITGNVETLQEQQYQLIQLLEFAQKQNSDLMRSVMSKRSGKNQHYHQNGKTSDTDSGIAVNQKG